jgi:hypothetical protein
MNQACHPHSMRSGGVSSPASVTATDPKAHREIRDDERQPEQRSDGDDAADDRRCALLDHIDDGVRGAPGVTDCAPLASRPQNIGMHTDANSEQRSGYPHASAAGQLPASLEPNKNSIFVPPGIYKDHPADFANLPSRVLNFYPRLISCRERSQPSRHGSLVVSAFVLGDRRIDKTLRSSCWR